jgi:orotate phosphoribosyltransferase
MDDLIEALSARRGHFRLESGHHGELWLDLDALFVRPAHVAPFVGRLAEQLSQLGLEVICGPLVGGAFVAQAIASQLGLECSWTERVTGASGDVINAGSATRATLIDLRECGARPVAIGALLVLGPGAADLAAAEGLALESVAKLANTLWAPADCPLCAAGVALEELA